MCMHKIIKDYMYMYSTVHQSPIMIPKDQLMSNQLGFGSTYPEMSDHQSCKSYIVF